MNLSNPINSVIPSAHGAVLATLARTYAPLSGRKIAQLTRPQVGHVRVSEILVKLAEEGLVIREEHPPAKVYRLNRDHVAAEAIEMLANQRSALLHRIREHLGEWDPEPISVCLFGSAARGEGTSTSDLDLLLVPPDDLLSHTLGEQVWEAQVDDLIDHVRRWSGNPCEVLQLTEAELRSAVRRDDRLVDDLRSDGVELFGQSIRELVRPELLP